MNLSSVVIQTKAEHLEEVLKVIQESTICEYHLHDEKGRIIVTLEGKNTGEEIAKLKSIQAMEYVVSAEMIFAYSEDELDAERAKLEGTEDNIPEWLNDPNAKASDIQYGGDLKRGV